MMLEASVLEPFTMDFSNPMQPQFVQSSVSDLGNGLFRMGQPQESRSLAKPWMTSEDIVGLKLPQVGGERCAGAGRFGMVSILVAKSSLAV